MGMCECMCVSVGASGDVCVSASDDVLVVMCVSVSGDACEC